MDQQGAAGQGPPVREYREAIADWTEYEISEDEVYVPAYTLGAEALAGGANLDAAVHSGWRVFAPTKQGGVLFCDMTSLSESDPPTIASVTETDRAAIALKALRVVQARAEMKDHELRWLSIPAILFEGFWLDSKSGGPGILCPVFSLDQELQADILPENFLGLVRSFAKHRLSYDDSPLYGNDVEKNS